MDVATRRAQAQLSAQRKAEAARKAAEKQRKAEKNRKKPVKIPCPKCHGHGELRYLPPNWGFGRVYPKCDRCRGKKEITVMR